MLFIILAMLSLRVTRATEIVEVEELNKITPHLVHMNHLKNVAFFKDAENRGPAWYDFSARSKESTSDLDSAISSVSYIEESKEHKSASTETSSDASSKDTTERRKATDMHRACVPCPHEMMKTFKNIGIKWICGGYQRARRTFKSDCMMRFRNCQDGTMFVKIHDRKCGRIVPSKANGTVNYHGKHWFYDYKT